MCGDRANEFCDASAPHDWTPCSAHESAAVRIRNDIRCKQALQRSDIALLRSADERFEQSALFFGADGRATPVSDVLPSARYELAAIYLTDANDLADL